MEKMQVEELNKQIEELNKRIEELQQIRANLKEEIIQLDDEILFQDFGVYQPQYSFASLDQYKGKLDEIRKAQKELIKKDKAAICRIDWKVNGSEKEGKKLIAENITQILRTFNIECNDCIDKVKFSNYYSTRNKICKAFETLNKLNETNNIEITQEYLKLKLEELDLAYEYRKKKKEEQEERRILNEQQRENERVAKEIELKRQDLEKEQIHYQHALERINEQLQVEQNEDRKTYIVERKDELENRLEEINKAFDDLDYREANQRAGYVYVISNIGAFGKDIYKIGMTRRLEPEERIAELSGASVPFKFDIHAMIFSNDAPKLEAALHNAFADKKVNLVNYRKEFFHVSLEEIKKVVQENHDKTVEFINLPDAEQYRESEMLRRKRQGID